MTADDVFRHRVVELVWQLVDALIDWRDATQPAQPAAAGGPANAASDGLTSLNHRYWFTTSEAAKHAGVHQQTVERACRSGELRASQPSGRQGSWRIHRDDLDAWLTGGEEARR